MNEEGESCEGRLWKTGSVRAVAAKPGGAGAGGSPEHETLGAARPRPRPALTPARPDGAALRAHTGVWGLPPLLFVAQNHSCRFVTLLPLSATCPFLFLFNATSFI